MTVITESTQNLQCPKSDGDITVRQIQIMPFLPQMAIIAGADASLETQARVGDDTHPALLAAQNDISMHTSSAPGLTGAIVANNMCGGFNDFQGSEVRFSDKMNVTLADVIRTSLELELLG